MAEAVQLRGMTWDHSRGYDPMVATAADFAARSPGVSITWEKRSLQAFADRPISEMANQYDLMVIDHPHVGEVARQGVLLALDGCGREGELATLASQSVGVSHRSYQFDGHQWALAIDAATPVAARRPDLLDWIPSRWDQVMDLARQGRVAFALIPVNALMTFFGMARNLGYPVAEDPENLMSPDHGAHVLGEMRAVLALMDRRCLHLDPIGIYEWMGRNAAAPAYSPFGYGYTNYSRPGYCAHPLTFHDAPGFGENGPRGTVLGGTGIAVSSACKHPGIAINYAFWIAGADCQKGLFFDAGGQPANALAWQDAPCNAASRDFFRNTRRTLEIAWLRPRYGGFMRLQDAGGAIVHACLSGDITEAGAISRLQAAYRESRR